jgi:hypothetical protein
MDVEKFVRHLCRLVLRHQMPVWNYFVNSFYSATNSLFTFQYCKSTVLTYQFFVNDELYKMSTYFRLDKLALHPQKTQFMLITNSLIAKNTKFLEVYFDTNLNLKFHNNHISSKISRSLNLLPRCKNLLSTHSLKTLYYSLTHCLFIYGIQIWGCSSLSITNNLFKKQKAAIRIVCNEKYSAYTESLFKSMETLPLSSLIEFFKIQFIHSNGLM